MKYSDYIKYHIKGDAGVEERMIASLSRALKMNRWDSFRFIYFYTMTYHIPSALSMLIDNERDKKKLKFRTDRRYVRCNGAFERLLNEMNRGKMIELENVDSTSKAYAIVSSWFYFGRYAAYLFLEVYINVFKPNWKDDVKYKWEKGENYTKGAISISGSNEKDALDIFLSRVKKDTGDNAFSIETSLCAVAKIDKGSRFDGYYTERMLEDARNTKWERLIYSNI